MAVYLKFGHSFGGKSGSHLTGEGSVDTVSCSVIPDPAFTSSQTPTVSPVLSTVSTYAPTPTSSLLHLLLILLPPGLVSTVKQASSLFL